MQKHKKRHIAGKGGQRALLCKLGEEWECYYTKCEHESFTKRHQLAKHLIDKHSDDDLKWVGLNSEQLKSAAKPKNHGSRRCAPEKKLSPACDGEVEPSVASLGQQGKRSKHSEPVVQAGATGISTMQLPPPRRAARRQLAPSHQRQAQINLNRWRIRRQRTPNRTRQK